jgi:hypothetical protein
MFKKGTGRRVQECSHKHVCVVLCSAHCAVCCCPAGIMHGYFLKLLGNYRSHIYLEGTGPGFTPSQPTGPLLNGLSQLPPNGRGIPGHQRSQSASTMHGSSSNNALAAFAAAAGGQDSRQSPRSTTSHGGAGSVSSSRRQSRASSSNIGPAVDEGMRAHGHWFDHSGLVASHRWVMKAVKGVVWCGVTWCGVVWWGGVWCGECAALTQETAMVPYS